MNMHPFSILQKTFIFTCLIWTIGSCSSNSDSKNVLNTNSSGTSSASQMKESLPDSIVGFLLTSASTDFAAHQPPTAIDFRKVQVGYVRSSTNEKIFLLCGEFLSEEKKQKGEWEPFATVKTSGYEQYLGDQALSFCQKATMVARDENTLVVELNNKLENLRKQQ